VGNGKPVRARVLALVLAADGNYRTWVDSIKETWGATSDDQVRTLYYYGLREGFPAPAKGKAELHGDVIVCDCVEAFERVLPKTVMTYELVLREFDFDYVFRCCATSYFHKGKALEFLKDKPRTGFYCGVPVPRPTVTFASGAGYFLSRDLVEKIASGGKKIYSYRIPWNMDDVAVAKLLFEEGIGIHPGALRGGAPTSQDSPIYHYHLKGRGGAKKMRDAHSILGGGG